MTLQIGNGILVVVHWWSREFPNIIVTSSTQTIFVRGEGGCVVPAACAQHVISGESYNTTTTIT